MKPHKTKIKAKLWKTGNSYVITLNPQVIALFGLKLGERVIVTLEKEGDDNEVSAI